MIPKDADEILEIEEIVLPSKDYKMDLDRKNIRGFTDEVDEIKQAVFKILNTERYDHLIYSWDYGIELKDLYGEPQYYVIPELERRIIEALTQDDRIDDVDGFEFKVEKDKIQVSFTVHTIFGDIEDEMEVSY